MTSTPRKRSPGAGRKPLPADVKKRGRLMIYLTASDLARVKALGGSPWVAGLVARELEGTQPAHAE